MFERVSDGGMLVVETGNFQSATRVLGGPDWLGYMNDHRWYFTPQTLAEQLRRAGFASCSCAGGCCGPG